MSLDAMKRRLNYTGGDIDGRLVKSKLKSMHKALHRSYQAEWITLNDEIYRVPGFYRSTSSTNSITNKPSEMNNGAFELVVTGIAESSYCTQTVKDISSNIFYVRTQTAWNCDINPIHK